MSLEPPRANGRASVPERMWLSDLSIRRPHFVTMLMAAWIAVGALFYGRMAVDFLPDISLPVVVVRTIYPGASPSEVERAISKPIEDAVVSLNGVSAVRSVSMESGAVDVVEFQLDRDPKEAAADVRTRLAAIRGRLPDDATEPVVEHFDPAAAPVLSLAISDTSGRRSPDQLRRMVEDVLKPRIERVVGVAAVEVSGGLVREIHVDLRRDRLEALGVAPQQVVQALERENLDAPAGRVPAGQREQTVRTVGQFRSLEEIREVVVPNARGATVRIGDLAEVGEGFAEVRNLPRLDGQDAVVAAVHKQSGANSVAVGEAVKHEIEVIRREHRDLAIGIAIDQSEFTREAVDDVQFSMVLGGVLAALVVLAFFRDWRNTLVTVAGLPVIVLGTFAAMHALGIGLNQVTLLALSLSVGMLIDDAIVVRENIFRRMEMGEPPRVAAQRGTAEIALAVLAVSTTIVAVFLPIAFTGGIVGKILREFGLVVSIAVFLSLIEAFTLAPMLSAHFFKRVDRDGPRDHRPGRVAALYGGAERTYGRLLGWSLGRRAPVLVLALGMFAASMALLPLMPRVFVPESDQGRYEVGLEMPPGTRLEETDQVVRRLEAVLIAQPDVVDVFTTVGSQGGTERATLSVKLTEKRAGVTHAAIARVRPGLERAASGARLTVDPATTTSQTLAGTAASGMGARAIQFSLEGPDLEALDRVSAEMVAALERVPGAVDVGRSVSARRPSLEVHVDRPRAADLGVPAGQVAATLRTLLNGTTAGVYRAGGTDADVVVRLRPTDRAAGEDLLAMPLLTPRGNTVPLSSVARVAAATEPPVVERMNRQRQIVVGVGYFGRSQSAVVSEARAAVAAVSLPPGVSVRVVGQEQYTEGAFSTLGIALGLAVIFVYMILCAQFSSFLHPFTIMLALPFSSIGALLALFAAGRGLDILAMIGLILLMGLVTKNSILLVEFTNQLRRRGTATREALVEAGRIRLRPILMTTLAMIFGMVPVALGLGAGGDLRQSMGIGVVGGLISSTLLTLIAVPVAYSVVEDGIALIRRPRRQPPDAEGHDPIPEHVGDEAAAAT